MIVAELKPELPDSWKKVNSYENSVYTLNEKCPCLSKNTTGGVESTNFSLITQNLEKFCVTTFMTVYTCKNDVVSLKHHFLLLFPCNFFSTT